jgi:hypothetical protein
MIGVETRSSLVALNEQRVLGVKDSCFCSRLQEEKKLFHFSLHFSAKVCDHPLIDQRADEALLSSFESFV